MSSEDSDTNISSFESNVTSSYESEDLGPPESMHGLQPYRFEPCAEEGAVKPKQIVLKKGPPLDDETRLGNTDWCKCKNCIPMLKTDECVCCREFEEVMARIAEDPHPCVTAHKNFHPVCLNEAVLETVYYQYREQHGKMKKGTNKNRYCGYRQFVRWCYKFLGKDIRVPMPSCVMRIIRETHASESGQYKGFEKERPRT